MKLLILLSLTLSFAPTLQAEKTRLLCDSSKEYITTLEFLRKQAGDAAPSREISNRKLAGYVSNYCSGAARRFIKVVRLFEKLDLGTNNAIPVAKDAVKVDDARVDLFLKVFKRLYVKSGFDLAPAQSLQVAKSFLKPTKVSAEYIYGEFDKLASFCESSKRIARNPYDCALIIKDLLASLNHHEANIAEAFIDSYKYLTRNKNLNLSSYDAVTLAKKMVSYGPNAIENFLIAVKYAVSNDGLKLSRNDALRFAEDLAKRSQIETDQDFKSVKTSSWWKFW